MNLANHLRKLGTIKGNANHLAPFPGKFPTRIFWNFEASRGKQRLRDSYIGKPNFEVQHRLSKLWWQVRGLSWHVKTTSCEFDKENVVLHQAYDDEAGAPYVVVGTLFSAYWPWSTPGNALSHLNSKFYPVRIGGQWVYSPWPVPANEYIRSYQSWLASACTVGKVKPAAKPATKNLKWDGSWLTPSAGGIETLRVTNLPATPVVAEQQRPLSVREVIAITGGPDMTGTSWPRGIPAPVGWRRDVNGTLRAFRQDPRLPRRNRG